MQSILPKRRKWIRKYNAHTHPYWEIVCQLEGEAHTQVGEHAFTAKPGDVFLVPPNTVHKGWSECEFCDLAVRSSDADFPAFTLLHDYRGELTALMSMITRVRTEREGDFRAVASALTEALCRMIRNELGTSAGTPAVEQIKHAIYENLSNAEFSLADAIAAVGFDKDHFRRCFKRETGKTPAQYLTDLRMSHAKQLLCDGQRLRVEDVARSCGFSDSLYFSTCFKKHVGLSPLAYRKKRWSTSEV